MRLICELICILRISFLFKLLQIYFFTRHFRDAIEAREISDAAQTNEQWFISPVCFIFVTGVQPVSSQASPGYTRMHPDERFTEVVWHSAEQPRATCSCLCETPFPVPRIRNEIKEILNLLYLV